MKILHVMTKRKVIAVGITLILLLIFILYGQCFKTSIVCAGDSLTYGSGVIETRDTDSYPAQLNDLLGRNYSVINCGRRNATASFSGDLPYVETDEYKESIEAAKKASIVILMLGANDSKTYNWDEENYKEGLKTLVESYQQLSNNPKVILMRPPFVYSLDGSDIASYDIQPAVVKDEVGKCIAEVAEEMGVEVIDLYSVTDGKEELYTDGIHFNKDGYGLIAETVYEFLKNKGYL